MIIDHISYLSRYQLLSGGLLKALAYLRENELSRLETGLHEIVGKDLFCIVSEYKTMPSAEGKLEAHKKYIDVHYMISGSELIGYALLEEQKLLQAYDAENDYALYDGNSSFISMVPGMFAIFFPNDLHMPGIGKDRRSIKKIVIKVKI